MSKINIKKLSAVLAVLLLAGLVLAGAGAAETSGSCGDGLTWSVDADNHLTITYDGVGTGAMNSYSSCGPWGRGITSLSLPEGLINIGSRAFYGCSWLSGELVIPTSVTAIGNEAFWCCSCLTGTLEIPSGVTSIGSSAFYYCNGFTGTLIIPSSVTSIGGSAFSDCSGINCVVLRGKLNSVGGSAFNNLSNNSIIYEKSYLSSQSSSYYSYDKTAIAIDNGDNSFLFYINDSSFPSGFPLTDANAPLIDVEGLIFDGWYDNRLYTGDKVTSVKHTQTRYAKWVKASICGDGLTWKINDDSKLTITYDGVGTGVMSNYSEANPAPWGTEITSLSLPEGLKTVGDYAFMNCSNLSGTLTIPSTVTSIGKNAFWSCSGYRDSLTIPSSVKTIDDGAFANCYFTGNLVIPDSVETIGNYAFLYCRNFAGSLVIPSSVKQIGDSAFSECTGFDGSLILSEGLEHTGNGVFYGCSGFTGSLIIPSSLKDISHSCFEKCSGFNESLMITNGVESVGNHAFDGCSGFTGNLTIPSSIIRIGDGAFQYCSGLTGDLSIPDSVTEIGGNAFSFCSGFTGSLTLPSGITTISNGAFQRCGLTGNLIIPDTVITIGNCAFSGCGFTGNLSIPVNVTTIGHAAFQNCKGFTGNLIIPISVTSIDKYAFHDCSGINCVILPENLENIGENAFLLLSKDSIIYTSGDSSLLSLTYSLDLTALAKDNDDNSFTFTVDTTSFTSGFPLNDDNAPVKDGYTFDGWYANSEYTGEKVTTVTNGQTLYAKWNGGLETNAYINVSSSPVGASVYVDGEYIGNTPSSGYLLKKVTANETHNLRVSASGYNTYTTSFYLAVAETRVFNPTLTVLDSLQLRAGWNFISVPMTLDSSMDTAGEFFEEVDMDNHSVLGYDSSTKSWKQLTASTVLKPLDAYWVYSKEDFVGTKTIVFDTQSPSVGNTKEIYKGWNAVGLNIDVTDGKNTLSAKSTFAGLDWNRYFEKYTTGAWTVIVNGGSTSESEESMIYAGAGGWLYANEDGILVGNAS